MILKMMNLSTLKLQRDFMSVMTASLLIGEAHPYDYFGIIPQHCLFLWEGHVARWNLSSIQSNDYVQFPVPKRPELIVPQLREILSQYEPDVVVASVLPNSSIEGKLDWMFEERKFSVFLNETSRYRMLNELWGGPDLVGPVPAGQTEYSQRGNDESSGSQQA